MRQSPPAQVGLAAAPGRLVFGINRKGVTDTKILTAWTEQNVPAALSQSRSIRGWS